MATPHASGAAILLYEQAILRDSNMSPELLRRVLNATGKSIDGFRRIDIEAALKTQINGFVIDDELDLIDASMGSIEFGLTVNMSLPNFLWIFSVELQTIIFLFGSNLSRVEFPRAT